MPAAPKPSQKTVTVTSVSETDYTVFLRNHGGIEEAGTSFLRAKLDGAAIMLDDEPFVGNPKTGTAALVARIVSPPKQYQAFWFDAESAEHADRPEKADSFCKSYFDEPTQARKFSSDGAECDKCPFSPWLRDIAKRCQWRGDLAFQPIDPDSGLYRPDIWTISLSTTGMIEWQGTNRSPVKGSVSDLNTMQKLARLAVATWPDIEPESAVVRGLTELALGNVLMEMRVLRGSTEDGARTWPVLSLTPTEFLEITAGIAEIAGPDTIAAVDIDDLPF